MLPLGTVTILVTLRYLKGVWADAVHERFDTMGSVDKKHYGIASGTVPTTRSSVQPPEVRRPGCRGAHYLEFT